MYILVYIIYYCPTVMIYDGGWWAMCMGLCRQLPGLHSGLDSFRFSTTRRTRHWVGNPIITIVQPEQHTTAHYPLPVQTAFYGSPLCCPSTVRSQSGARFKFGSKSFTKQVQNTTLASTKGCLGVGTIQCLSVSDSVSRSLLQRVPSSFSSTAGSVIACVQGVGHGSTIEPAFCAIKGHHSSFMLHDIIVM
jgi:hypothetical protein